MLYLPAQHLHGWINNNNDNNNKFLYIVALLSKEI